MRKRLPSPSIPEISGSSVLPLEMPYSQIMEKVLNVPREFTSPTISENLGSNVAYAPSDEYVRRFVGKCIRDLI